MPDVRADPGSQVSALGVGFAIWRPFRCKHRIMHRKRGPGQQGLRVVTCSAPRNLDGNQIAWKYRACAGHADLLFRDGVKRQAGTVIAYSEFTSRTELFPWSSRESWPQQHVPERFRISAARSGTVLSHLTSFRRVVGVDNWQGFTSASSCEGGRAPRCGVREQETLLLGVPCARYPSSEFGWWFARYGTYPGAAPPGYEIPPLRGWLKPLQDPTPVKRAKLLPECRAF